MRVLQGRRPVDSDGGPRYEGPPAEDQNRHLPVRGQGGGEGTRDPDESPGGPARAGSGGEVYSPEAATAELLGTVSTVTIKDAYALGNADGALRHSDRLMRGLPSIVWAARSRGGRGDRDLLGLTAAARPRPGTVAPSRCPRRRPAPRPHGPCPKAACRAGSGRYPRRWCGAARP